MLEEKELWVALGKKAEVEQAPKRGLAKIVGILLAVFG